METIRKFIDFCGPAVYGVRFLLAIWVLSQTEFSALSLGLGTTDYSGLATLGGTASAAVLIVAYFAALLLNYGDFARFAKSERAMQVGNFFSLPLNFFVFSIITVIVTSGTIRIFGHAIADPVLIVQKLGNPSSW